MISSLAFVPWKVITLAFLLSSFSAEVQVDAFVPSVGRASNQIPLSSLRILRLSKKVGSPTKVRSSRSSKIGNSNSNNNAVPSVPDSTSAPRWNLWKRLRNRIATPTSMPASSVSSTSSSANISSLRSGSRWIKAAGAFAAFVFLRPLAAVASGGGLGGGARKTPLPPLERYVTSVSYYIVMHRIQ
jgi:hypothetical protein